MFNITEGTKLENVDSLKEVYNIGIRIEELPQGLKAFDIIDILNLPYKITFDVYKV